MVLQLFDVMVVDPDAQSRMRFRQAAISGGRFTEIIQVNSVEEAQHKIQFIEKLDIIFVSAAIPLDQFSKFVTYVRKDAKDKDSSFVSMFRAEDDAPSLAASYGAVGADGFLVQPYSIDALNDICLLSTEKRAERRLAREAASVKLMAKNAIEQLDELSFLKKYGATAQIVTRTLKNTVTPLQVMDEAARARAHDILVDKFQAVPPPKDPVSEDGYDGTSRAVRKRQMAKLIARLKEKHPGN